MRRGLIACALLSAACGSSPSSPTPTPIPTPTPALPAAVIQISGCPLPTITLPNLDVTFYRQIACNLFEGAFQAPRRWLQAPKLYIRTVDEAGVVIDAVTLDTVTTAMRESAAALTSGRFGLDTIDRGTETKEGVSGWITVTWSTGTTGTCGLSDVARDGGTIDLRYRVPNCDFGCGRGAIRPRTARHELGHALGYWHTDSADDLMSGLSIMSASGERCDASLSAREQQAAAYHYR